MAEGVKVGMWGMPAVLGSGMVLISASDICQGAPSCGSETEAPAGAEQS